ncbi:MAG: hypothetical protein SPL22_08225 [Treponema sp.]|uniref:hypothetical protein n=1 Tax=Treponema sp. TaxID=166 RepID=UPI002A911277|nr:hypothetical protein [Treponema sp.]MDY6397705.1 hypothetical protein [Treponema sp.]
MQARDIKGYNNHIYTLEELKKIPQHKHSFGVPEGANTFYYQNMINENLEGEQFRSYPDDELIEVSNYGRARINNEIIKQYDNRPENLIWLTSEEHKQIPYPNY